MGFDQWMLHFDEFVTGILGQWDRYTSIIFIVVLFSFVYSVISFRDPDAHPMLLARQAQASPVRQEGESAVFRSHSAPHGMPLNSGLNIKDPGDSKWSRGRDGDIRDIWRRVIGGSLDREGNETGEIGKLFTILGSNNIVEHKLSDITRQINLIGQHIKTNGGQRVAIYLPNSVEFIATLFASVFYDLTPILIPYDQPIEEIGSYLRKSKVDTIVAAVGSLPFDAITTDYSSLKQLIWVVDEGSKHMDWDEVPTGTGGAVNVSTWQEIIQDAETTSGQELPATDRSIELKSVVAFSPSGDVIEYTHANIIAGIAGQLTSVPSAQRISHSDLFLAVDAFSNPYTLVLLLSALHSNASVALTSIAGHSPDLTLATQGVAPTIIVASAGTLAKVHSETTARLNSSLYKAVHWLQTRSLVQNGVMPLASMFSRTYDSLLPVIGSTPGKLRLIYVSEQPGADQPPLSSQELSDLRIYTGSRIIYALTSPSVAGAVTQTGLYDYRVDEPTTKYSHFGAPVTSVEVYFKDTNVHKTTDEVAAGEIRVRGPAVVGQEASLGIAGKMKDDHTLALL